MGSSESKVPGVQMGRIEIGEGVVPVDIDGEVVPNVVVQRAQGSSFTWGLRPCLWADHAWPWQL